MRINGILTSGSLVALLVGFGSASHAATFGCQASGSLPIFPSTGTTCGTALHPPNPVTMQPGDLVDILVTTTNTSSSTPPGTQVPAKLVNVCVGGTNAGAGCTVAGDCNSTVCGPAIVYTLACTTTVCAQELPGILTFVPVGGNGCVSNAPAVTACQLDATDVTGNTVDIIVNAAGVPLSAGATNVPIATIRAQATGAVPFSVSNPCGQFGTRADTSGNSIVTTDTQCSATATGGAQGSTNLFLPQATATATATPTPTRTPTQTATPTQTTTPTQTATPTTTATRTATVTATPTVTATRTVTPSPSPRETPTRHYQCYELHEGSGNKTDVTLGDANGPSDVTIGRAKRICAPADKNDEDEAAPQQVVHLKAYEATQDTHFRPRVANVTNQFGTFNVTLARVDFALVPANKSLDTTPPPAPAIPGTVNHYKCYALSQARFRLDGVKVDDQFGTTTVKIKRPGRLCLAADKNEEGVPKPAFHLLCYLARKTSGVFTGPTVFVTDQFGSKQHRVFGARELCVPTVVNMIFPPF